MAQRKKTKKKTSAKKKVSSKKRAPAKLQLVSLTLVNQSSFKPTKAFIEKWVNQIALELQSRSAFDDRLQNLDWAGAELAIAFLDEARARELNKTYRGRDYATDVLSFSDSQPGVLGELAICPEVVRSNAVEHGLGFDEELGYMILHGVLHLLGFDHEQSKGEEKRMFTLQDSVFEVLRQQF